MGTQGLKSIVGSFVLRKEVGDEDDMSVSDMDCSEDEANKPAIEVFYDINFKFIFNVFR